MSKFKRLHGVDCYEILDPEKAKKDGLPTVSRHLPSLFYFTVSRDGEHAAAEIRITPTRSGDRHNPFYEPEVRLLLLSDQASQSAMESECQKVYNSCIRPIQWDFQECRCVAWPHGKTSLLALLILSTALWNS
jgi:hypothetical protein